MQEKKIQTNQETTVDDDQYFQSYSIVDYI